MPTLQYLTLAEAKARCRDAWCRGELSAQQHTEGTGCEYVTSNGAKCAIGICLNPAMIEWVKGGSLYNMVTDRNAAQVQFLISAGVLDTDDRDGLCKLQVLHDNILRMLAYSRFQSVREFLAYIYS